MLLQKAELMPRVSCESLQQPSQWSDQSSLLLQEESGVGESSFHLFEMNIVRRTATEHNGTGAEWPNTLLIVANYSFISLNNFAI